MSCNKAFPKKELLKVLPTLEIDLEQNIPSKSFYVYPSEACINNLQKSHKKIQRKLKLTKGFNEEFFNTLLVNCSKTSCPSLVEEVAI